MTHTVGFEETNFVGNVYWVNHLRWQGRCRELFLKEKAPSVLGELQSGLAFITTKCSCEYHTELAPFDEIAVRMLLEALSRSRMTLAFEYWRKNPRPEILAARGTQEIACMRREGVGMVPAPFPEELERALRSYLRQV